MDDNPLDAAATTAERRMNMRRCMVNAESHCKLYPRCYGCNAFRNPTNADRIRAMNDEELVEFIKNIKVRAALCKSVKNNDAFDELCSAEWLQQPAEGE